MGCKYTDDNFYNRKIDGISQADLVKLIEKIVQEKLDELIKENFI